MIINGLENKDHSGWTRSGDLVRGGFWTMAWEDLDLQRDLDALVRNGWIDENRWRRISISDAGIGWKDEMT